MLARDLFLVKYLTFSLHGALAGEHHGEDYLNLFLNRAKWSNSGSYIHQQCVVHPDPDKLVSASWNESGNGSGNESGYGSG